MVSGLQMIQNFASTYGAMQNVIMVIAYLTGTFCGINGFMKINGAAQHQNTYREAFAWLLTGSFLLSMGWAMTQATETFFSGANPLTAMAYQSPSGNAAQILAQAAVGLIVLLGWATGIRGLWLMFIGGAKGKDTFYTGAVHLLSGGIAVNIIMFIGAITTTLGIGTGWESTLGL